METLLQLAITPVIILLMARINKKIKVKDARAAIITSLIIFVIGFLIGWFLTFILNLATLGIFWFIGLGFVTRIIAYAFVIEIADLLNKKFVTIGFMPSLYLSCVLAIGWGLIEIIV